MSRLTMVPLGKEAMVRRRRTNILKISTFVALLFITLSAAWLLKGVVTSWFVKTIVDTEPARIGQLADTRELPGWLIRDEVIVNAPVTGRIEPLVEDYERVRLGTTVARVRTINPSGMDMGEWVEITSPRSGLVVYAVDGLEDIMSVRILEEREAHQISSLREKERRIEANQLIQQGQPLFKIINNLDKAHFLAHYKIQELGRALVPGARVTLALSPEGPTFSARVINVRGGDEAWVLLQLSNPSVDIMKERKVNFQLVDKIHRGIVLPTSALVEKDGQSGVLLSIKKRAQWRPVEVIAVIDKQMVVQGIDEGQLVVLNPQYIQEGQEIK
ncbi:HlyD family efflux transporter periplasmic adaptor subunit [Heliorestis convoluta]|uniref:RND related barrel-sandwich hybrid domain-containing protein n=1 Tax=Heliorestis convoluta TaxID=356322 RepID=A0A5Q2MYF4_9FIRM|nr:HlyD family efflux transporter periplasmic adaptor subunit [Heliorestis convoluta]QGG47944.1 hypothetical protein FTV88_1846 [Heliorestis convoluta]